MKHSFGGLVLAAGFLLGLYGGRLALFSGTSGQLLEVFPLRAESLPPADQEALKTGIRVESEAVLPHYLEDYLS